MRPGLRILGCAGIGLLAAACSTPEPVIERTAVFAPARGLSCDSALERCFDDDGANAAVTGIYYGDSAAAQTRAESAEQRARGARFEPLDGVVCYRDRQICYSNTGPNPTLSSLVFGATAGVASAGRRDSADTEGSGIVEPSAGVSCDLVYEVCFEDALPSEQQTRWYFGDAAGDRLADQLN